MVRKRHPKKSGKWLYRKYRKAAGGKYIFSAVVKTQKGVKKTYRVIRTSSIGIKRHIKIKADANPYDPKYAAYFWQRRNKKESKLLPALSAREFRAQFA